MATDSEPTTGQASPPKPLFWCEVVFGISSRPTSAGRDLFYEGTLELYEDRLRVRGRYDEERAGEAAGIEPSLLGELMGTAMGPGRSSEDRTFNPHTGRMFYDLRRQRISLERFEDTWVVVALHPEPSRPPAMDFGEFVRKLIGVYRNRAREGRIGRNWVRQAVITGVVLAITFVVVWILSRPGAQ